MAFQQRISLIKKLEMLRGSSLITYLTSVRPGISAQIAEDQVRVFYDHLCQLKNSGIEKLDLFLVSNGGAGTVPWSIVSLAREFAKQFNVLVPYRAYSAATLIALGADEIVMHPLGQLGPIDPSVANDFNPREQPSNRVLPISVEDVKAYVQFIKTTVGISHEDELVKTIEILANQIHPLALGNVERFVQQSRMMARKLLRTHMTADQEHAMDEITENLASKLYFHGHPINRKEARQDLRLKVAQSEPELERAMWELYLDYEAEFENNSVFSPMEDLNNLLAAQLAATTSNPVPTGTVLSASKEYGQLVAIMENASSSSAMRIRRRFTAYKQGAQLQLQEESLEQGWNHQVAT